MDSLIAHIAGKHGLPRENLATEVLVYLLESSSLAVVREILASYGVTGDWNSYGYRFEPQRRAVDGRSIPDVQVRDANGECRAFIESKFYASLTDQQPVAYLEALSVQGVLLFIVPERRTRQIFDDLLEKCRSSECFEQVAVSDPILTCAWIEGKRMEVTSWKELLERFAKCQKRSDQSPDEQHLRLSDIEQLGRFCEMANKEAFEPLSLEQIRGIGISAVIRQLTWVTSEVITRCLTEKIVQPMLKSTKSGAQNALRADADSSLYYGQNVRLCGLATWIGFWGEAWEERQQSPLWMEINRDEPGAGDVVRQLQTMKGTDAVVRRHNGDWLIPIPIKEGRYQDALVEDAVRFLSELRDIARKATTKAAK